jgi:hypothetical protein
MLLGLIVAFLPSFGVPSDWKVLVQVAAGALLVLVGYSLRRSMYLRTIDKGNGERGTDAFLEFDGSSPRILTDDAASADSDHTQFDHR